MLIYNVNFWVNFKEKYSANKKGILLDIHFRAHKTLRSENYIKFEIRLEF